MAAYLSIGLGSALGGMARHALTLWVAAKWPAGFPWGTLLVNIVGSFLIGVIATLPDARFPSGGGVLARQFLVVGVLGGFTTFSAFSLQTLSLFQQGRPAAAALYILLSVTVCLAAAGAGCAAVTGSLAARP